MSTEDDEQKVTITLGELKHLRRNSAILQELRNAGVDNWEGYDEACRNIRAIVGEAEED